MWYTILIYIMMACIITQLLVIFVALFVTSKRPDEFYLNLDNYKHNSYSLKQDKRTSAFLFWFPGIIGLLIVLGLLLYKILTGSI